MPAWRADRRAGRPVALMMSVLLHGVMCAGVAGLVVRGRPVAPELAWGWVEAPVLLPSAIAAAGFSARPAKRPNPIEGVRPVRVGAREVRAAPACCLVQPAIRQVAKDRAPERAESGPALALPPPVVAAPADLVRGVAAAIERAKFYPAMARRQRRQGDVEVGFDYLNGSVGHLRLLQAAGSRSLDDAALLAVRTAGYPPTPDGLSRTRFRLALWIRFMLAPAGDAG